MWKQVWSDEFNGKQLDESKWERMGISSASKGIG